MSQSLTSSITGTPTTELQSEDFDNRVRAYILDTLTPFVPTEDKTGRFLITLLRRFLKSAAHEDLQRVVVECVRFSTGLQDAGLYVDPEALVSESAEYLASIPGSSTLDWPDQAGEIDSGEASDNSVPYGDDGAGEDETEVATAEDSSTGHETEMAGDEDIDGEEHDETVREESAG